jgi:general secretion pathway protein L
MMQLQGSTSIRFHQFSNGLREFFRWWQGELLALVPERLHEITRLERQRWILELEGEKVHAFCLDKHEALPALGYRFSLDEDSEQRSLAWLQLKDRDPERSEIILRLPSRQVLSKVLTLPLAVEENLRQVLGFELDQQTPFKAEQVYYDFQILRKNPATQQLSVRFTAVPRGFLDGILARLGTHGIEPDVVDVAATGSSPLAVNLLPSDRRQPRKPILQRLNLVLAGLACLLFIATLALPLWHKAQREEKLQTEIAAVQKEAQSVSSLRRQLDELTRQANFLAEAKTASPVLVQVLNELTRLLPDGTWLHQLELNGKEVVMQGESPASSAIIGLIEASPLFRNVTYRSPVTQNRVTGAERFNLAAEVTMGLDS